jgi:two-component system CheB/CheR fusion protein
VRSWLVVQELATEMTQAETTPEFEALLSYLKDYRGWDLTGYKRSTLVRRFGHRMQQLNINNYAGYLRYLQRHSEEYLALLDDTLINVTQFFRDHETWAYLASDIIPNLLAGKQPNDPIRIWSAGCATGQEIYSILMLLAETLGCEACLKRVQCYATDMDEAALQQARQGIYNEVEIANIPADLLDKYFEQTEKGYVFQALYRRNIIFGRHDLTKDPPLSKIDILICRNVLIYLQTHAQAAILTRFHFALRDTGVLILGKAELVTLGQSLGRPIRGYEFIQKDYL